MLAQWIRRSTVAEVQSEPAEPPTAAPGASPARDADVLAALEADLTAAVTPPILSASQRQGDVLVQADPGMARASWTARRLRDRRATWLGDGQEVVIVPDGNRHVLVAHIPDGGRIRVWRQAFANLVLTMEIVYPAWAELVQPSGPNPHAPLGVGYGWYAICRQVEPQVYSAPGAASTVRPTALSTPPAVTRRPDTREAWAAAHNLFVVD